VAPRPSQELLSVLQAGVVLFQGVETEDDDKEDDDADDENEEDDRDVGFAVGDGDEVENEYGGGFDEYHEIVQGLEFSSEAHGRALETQPMRMRNLYHRFFRAGANLPRLSR